MDPPSGTAADSGQGSPGNQFQISGGRLPILRGLTRDQTVFMNPNIAAWLPSAEALGQADDIFLTQLQEPDLEPLTSWLTTEPARASADRDVFEDAVFDISRLLEEYRYETGVAAAYSIGLKTELDTLADEQLSGPASMGIPSSVRALLAPYTAHLPLPSRLFTYPAEPISGFRLLGGWWAGQLYDTALVRGCAALDRLATALYCVEGLKVDREWMPAFKPRHLKRITAWNGASDWDALLTLLNDPFFALAKKYRDGFIHQRRGPIQLHGDYVVAGDGSTTIGTTPEIHEAIVVGYYNLILLPACSLVGKLIQTPIPDANPSGAA